MKFFKLFLFFSFLSSFVVHAQNKIKYIYDDSGNRITREIALSSKSAKQEEPEIFTEEIAKRIVKIYPNPTKGQLQVEIVPFEQHQKAVLTVFSLSGQKILSVKVQHSMTPIDLSHRANGIYILHISIDKETSSWKIIKE